MRFFIPILSLLLLISSCGPEANKRYRVEKPSYQSAIAIAIDSITADTIYFTNDQQVLAEDSKCPIDFKFLELGYAADEQTLTLFSSESSTGQQYQRFLGGTGIEGTWYREETRTDFDDNDYLYRVELRISQEKFVYTQTCAVI